MSWIDLEIQADFTRARRQAFAARLRSMLNRSANDLLPLVEVRQRLNAHGQHYLGLQKVPLDQIIGSESRYADFDRSFYPRRDNMKTRWARVYKAHYEAIDLPPVELYKVGDIYFVRDGNHRVSVARYQNQSVIDAYVTEIVVDVPVSNDISVRNLLLMEEYSDFLEWTGLHRLRPEQRITFSELGGYLDLIKHINVHRYYLGLEQGQEISRDTAITGWYDHVYMSVITIIREQHVLSRFPRRTEADLYRWIMEHRWYMCERNNGTDPGAQAAAADYVALFGQRSLVEATEELLYGVTSALRTISPDQMEQ